MTDFATLVLAADTRQMTQAERAIDGVTKAGGRAEKATGALGRGIDDASKKTKAFSGNLNGLKNALAAVTSALAVKELINYTNTWSDLQSRVGLAVQDMTAAPAVLDRISQMARRTFSSLDQTAEAFLRNATGLRELGLSTNRSLDFVEALNNALVVSGAKAQQAESAQNALSNALALGTLSGQNLNTILTSGGRVAELLAQSLGTTTLGLRQMGADGKITGDVIINSLVNNLDLLRQEADNMPATIGDAMTLINNALLTTVGSFDQMFGASSAVANILILLADNMDRAVVMLGTAAAAFVVYRGAVIAAQIATIGLSSALVVARAALLRLGLGIIIVAAGELAFRISKLIESTGGWGNALSLLGDVASGVWEGITTSASAILPGLASVWQSLRGDFLLLTSDLAQYWADFLGRMANALEGVPVFKALEEGLRNASTNVTNASGSIAASAGRASAESQRLAETARNNLTSGFQIARDALFRLNTTVEQNIDNTEDGTDAANALNVALDNVSDGAGGAGAAVKGLNDDLQQTPQFVTEVSDAFADLVMRGFKDFQSFAQSVVNTFRNMLRDMIAMAARNRIMISLGMGGTGAPAMAGSGMPGIQGTMSSMVGSFGSAGVAGTGFLGGAGSVVSGFASGGFAGGGAAISTAMAGATSSLAGFAAAAGAIAVPLLAVAAVISFFRTKTKELDQGLLVTVNNMDTLVQSFRTVERSRFWGLSKRVSTTMEAAADEIANPIIDAVSEMQQGALDAAAALGIGADAFAGFTHELNISLKGLNEQQAMQKITEELGKMGDAFAAMVPGIQSLNELLAVAQQRYDLTTRLLQLQGNEEELLRRHREQELGAVHELNRELLLMIHSLEDAAIAAQRAQEAAQNALQDAQSAVASAFAGLRRAVDAEKNRLRDGFAAIIDSIDKRLRIANDAARASAGIFNALDRALRERRGQHLTDAMFAQRRVAALAFLQSQQGMQVTDEQALNDALAVVAEPSSKLFRNFTDYQRDFNTTSLLIDDLQSTAKVQLAADEKAVKILEDEQVSAKVRFEAQMLGLDQQLETMERQFNAMMGVDDSVKSVAEAVRAVESAIGSLGAAMAAAQAAAAQAAAASVAAAANAAGGGGGGADGGAGSSSGPSFAEQFGTGQTYKGFNLASIGSAAELLQAASSLGVQTTGKSGADIQQAISNASGMAVQMGASIRAREFAMGGLHSGGARIVGERGPELEVTGSSRIFSHNDTMNMLSNAPVVLELRRLKRELEQMRDEQRQLGIQTATNTDRSYRILRSWDVVGLPEERTA